MKKKKKNIISSDILRTFTMYPFSECVSTVSGGCAGIENRGTTKFSHCQAKI